MDNPPLIAAVKDFLAAHNMKPTTFGRLAMRDPHFVRDLEAGQRRMFPETEAKARHFMATYEPASEQAAA
jgi:hypothetical protein